MPIKEHLFVTDAQFPSPPEAARKRAVLEDLLRADLPGQPIPERIRTHKYLADALSMLYPTALNALTRALHAIEANDSSPDVGAPDKYPLLTARQTVSAFVAVSDRGENPNAERLIHGMDVLFCEMQHLHNSDPDEFRTIAFSHFPKEYAAILMMLHEVEPDTPYTTAKNKAWLEGRYGLLKYHQQITFLERRMYEALGMYGVADPYILPLFGFERTRTHFEL